MAVIPLLTAEAEVIPLPEAAVGGAVRAVEAKLLRLIRLLRLLRLIRLLLLIRLLHAKEVPRLMIGFRVRIGSLIMSEWELGNLLQRLELVLHQHNSPPQRSDLLMHDMALGMVVQHLAKLT